MSNSVNAVNLNEVEHYIIWPEESHNIIKYNKSISKDNPFIFCKFEKYYEFNNNNDRLFKYENIVIDTIWVPENLRNKGIANTLLSITISNLRKKYPDHKIECRCTPDRKTNVLQAMAWIEEHGFNIGLTPADEEVYIL